MSGDRWANGINKMPQSKSKYRNKPTEVDGVIFQSKREAARYRELRLLERAGQIDCLRLQVPYPLIVEGHKVGKYVADFVYLDRGDLVVEDCKGIRTPVYRLKAKLMKAIHGIEILET